MLHYPLNLKFPPSIPPFTVVTKFDVSSSRPISPHSTPRTSAAPPSPGSCTRSGPRSSSRSSTCRGTASGKWEARSSATHVTERSLFRGLNSSWYDSPCIHFVCLFTGSASDALFHFVYSTHAAFQIIILFSLLIVLYISYSHITFCLIDDRDLSIISSRRCTKACRRYPVSTSPCRCNVWRKTRRSGRCRRQRRRLNPIYLCV